MLRPQPKKSIRLTGKAFNIEKLKAYKRDGFRCQVCGQVQGSEHDMSRLHPHHIILRSELRIDEADNLLTTCIFCHVPWVHDAHHGWSTRIVKEKYWDRINKYLGG